MRKRLLCLVCAAAMAVTLWGCEPQEEPEETTGPTMPTLNQQQSPEEILRAAAEKAKALEAYDLDYVTILGQDRFALSGQIRKEADGSHTALTMHCTFSEEGVTANEVDRYYRGSLCWERTGEQVQQVPSGSAYTPEEIFGQVRQFPQELIGAFCAHELNAIPSQDGSFRFQVEELTGEVFEKLTGLPCSSEEAVGIVALTVSAEGYLGGLEFTAPDAQLTLTLRTPEEEGAITAPDWVQ